MKIFTAIITLLVSSALNGSHYLSTAITNDAEYRGRLGDHLTLYIQAKWIEHKFNIKYLYSPFPYSTEFTLHDKETPFSLYSNNFGTKKPFSTINLITMSDSNLFAQPHSTELSATLYISTWFSYDQASKYDWIHDYLYQEKITHNLQFIQKIRSLISPCNPIKIRSLNETSKDSIAIAMHIRTGCNFDTQKRIIKFAEKFPPAHFYIKAIQALHNYMPNKKLSIFVFTDDDNPTRFINLFLSELPNLDITFHYENTNNAQGTTVINDLFSMAQFDYFIRPHSALSRIAELLGNHKMVIYPDIQFIKNKGYKVSGLIVHTPEKEETFLFENNTNKTYIQNRILYPLLSKTPKKSYRKKYKKR